MRTCVCVSLIKTLLPNTGPEITRGTQVGQSEEAVVPRIGGGLLRRKAVCVGVGGSRYRSPKIQRNMLNTNKEK